MIQLQLIPNDNVLTTNICSLSSIYPFLCWSELFQYVTGSWDQASAFLKGKGVSVSPRCPELFRIFCWGSFLFGCSSTCNYLCVFKLSDHLLFLLILMFI